MWSAQINDIIGGWIVTKDPKPLSENRRENVIAECISEQDAQRIADALNRVVPEDQDRNLDHPFFRQEDEV